MIEICIAFVVSSLLLAAGIIVVTWTRSEKRRKQGIAIGLVSVVLLASTCVLGVYEYVRDNGLPIPDYWGGDVSGSAAAIYRYQTVIPADNGSVFIAWSSNAGMNYTTHESYSKKPGAIHLAKVNSSGKKMLDIQLDGRSDPAYERYLANSRFQDGYLFLNTPSLSIFDAGGNAATRLQSSGWYDGRLYHLPGGPMLFPWDKAPVHGGILDNALPDPGGNITFLSRSLYQDPFTGPSTTSGNDLYCSVIDGTGALLVNQSRLPTLYRWLRVPVVYGMDLDPSGRLVLACVAGPDWQQDNATHFVLNAFDANFTLAVNVSLDQAGGYFESLELLDVQCPEEGHFRLLLSRAYVEGYHTANEHYTVRLDLIDMTFPKGQSPGLQTTNLLTSPSSADPSGALSPDGKTVYVAHLVKGELFLKSLDLAGKPRFGDVRLTPTNDEYSWNYPSNW